MALNLSQELTQRQQPSVQMLHALSILRMNAQELRDYVKEFAMNNPVVEIIDAPPQADAHIPHSLRVRSHNEQIVLSDPRSSTYTLAEDLEFQLLGLKLDHNLEKNVKFLIHCLDERGYLPVSVAELVTPERTESALNEALAVLQDLEPRGVGARSLSECLLLQLRDVQDNRIALEIAKNYLSELAKNKFPRLAQMLSCSVEEVEYAVTLIRNCVPKPANGYAANNATPHIIPDLYIFQNDDRQLQIVPEASTCFRIQINAHYQSLLSSDIDATTAKYLKACISKASSVIDFIAGRNINLMQCAGILVARQEAFFRRGPAFLQPLSLRDIAQEMQVSESTVSRTIQGKYFRCIWGLFPLKHLLSRSVSNTADGKGMNSVSVCAAIADIVSRENKKAPLSDQAISEKLLAQGIVIPRRTVAKYRAIAEIEPAAQRKQQ